MSRLVVIFILGLSHPVSHGEVVHAPEVIVWSRDPSAMRRVYDSDSYKILDNEDQEREWKQQGYFPPHARDAMFNRLKITEAVRGLSEYRKDMLVIQAHALNPKRLKVNYPMLTEAQIKSLQTTVREAGW